MPSFSSESLLFQPFRGKPYSDFFHHRLVLPVLELHKYWIIWFFLYLTFSSNLMFSEPSILSHVSTFLSLLLFYFILIRVFIIFIMYCFYCIVGKIPQFAFSYLFYIIIMFIVHYDYATICTTDPQSWLTVRVQETLKSWNVRV